MSQETRKIIFIRVLGLKIIFIRVPGIPGTDPTDPGISGFRTEFVKKTGSMFNGPEPV